VWSGEKLRAWLTDPEALVPGQAMGYSLSQADDRLDVVAFLQSLAQTRPAP
jgi:cytochrome c